MPLTQSIAVVMVAGLVVSLAGCDKSSESPCADGYGRDVYGNCVALEGPADGDDSEQVSDDDGDGYASSIDCDDTDALVNPGVREDCSTAYDDNCDGGANEDGALGCFDYYPDQDGDGIGGPSSICTCEPPGDGWVTLWGDCDDTDENVSPGAIEACDDGVDQDCSGEDLACPPDRYAGTSSVEDGYSWKVYGDGQSEFGRTTAVLDFNGDGVDDIAVGEEQERYGETEERGIAYVFFSPFASESPEVASDRADLTFYNVEDAWEFNWPHTMANIGDVNEDGTEDLFIGVVSDRVADDGGRVVFGGSDGAIPGTDAALEVGCFVAAYAGNHGPDPEADAWLCSDYSAQYIDIYVGTEVVGSLIGENYGVGASVAGGDDIDGDGIDDVVIGDPNYDSEEYNHVGAAYVVLGPTHDFFYLSGADMTILGTQPDAFRVGVWAGLGDIDNDGAADVVVAAEQSDTSAGVNSGAVFVFLGRSGGSFDAAEADIIVLGEQGAGVGEQGLDLGDANGDGALDLLVAGSDDDGGTSAGAVWLEYGPLSSGSFELAFADAKFIGANSGEALGRGSRFLGDQDGDSDSELLLSARNGSERGYLNYGAVWIWEGR